ncbi:hypothetical protein AGMMS50262_23440 [Bacteroidia bacterium]|nr:hypothetical protein AGMMS50262_23440 [Bacteroidia bacterium]
MSRLTNSVVLVGAGNVATHLGLALRANGFSVEQVYSRTIASAETLGKQLNASYTDRLDELYCEADWYILSVKDDVLPEIIEKMPTVSGWIVHTSGSVSIDVFAGSKWARYGVLYPLQTFSKNRKIDFSNIPVFIEASSPEAESELKKMAQSFTNTVIHLNSEKRKYLHLSAVFACNFTNHLYALASEILDEQQLSWELLLPLIRETADKIEALSQEEAQTGPAARNDKAIMEKHLQLLENSPDKQLLYRLLSESIYSRKTKNKPTFATLSEKEGEEECMKLP